MWVGAPYNFFKVATPCSLEDPQVAIFSCCLDTFVHPRRTMWRCICISLTCLSMISFLQLNMYQFHVSFFDCGFPSSPHCLMPETLGGLQVFQAAESRYPAGFQLSETSAPEDWCSALVSVLENLVGFGLSSWRSAPS